MDASRLAFLAFDRNGDGVINDGSELFGDHTVPGAQDGFSALARLVELEGPVQIAEVNSSNVLFGALLLWQDYNRDGVSQPTELRPASDVLQAVGLGMSLTGKKDPIGNAYRYKGWARFTGRQGEDDLRCDTRSTAVKIVGRVRRCSHGGGCCTNAVIG